jgi:hypothetical protein
MADSAQEQNSFAQSVKNFKKINAPKKIFNLIIDGCERKELSQRDILFGFRTLWQMNRTDLCVDMFPYIERRVDSSFRLNDDVVIAMMRSFSSISRPDLLEATVQLGTELDSPVSDCDLTCTSTVLVEFVAALAQSGDIERAIQLLNALLFRKSVVDIEMSKRIMSSVLKRGKFDNIRTSLLRLLLLGGLDDNDSIQLFSNSFMKNVTFIKGAISMDTLPPGTFSFPNAYVNVFIA